jgi:hypothetical protein
MAKIKKLSARIFCGATRRGEDCTVVLFEKRNPRRDVVGMTQLPGDAQVGAEECGVQFRDLS